MIEEATVPAHPAFGSAVSRSNGGGPVMVHDPSVLTGPAMDTLVREAVFAPGDARDQARWLIWELGQAVGVRPSSIHDLYMARGPRRRPRLHRAGDERPRHGVRHGAGDLPRREQARRRRVHPRDRALRDRLHRPASSRVRGRHAGRGAARGVPRSGVHPGRSLPGEREEVRGRPGRRGERREGSSLARRSTRASTTSTSTRRRSSTSRSRTSTEQQRRNFEVCVDITQVRAQSSSRRASRSRWVAKSARSAR